MPQPQQDSKPVLVLHVRTPQQYPWRRAPPSGQQHAPAGPGPRRPASPDAAKRTRSGHSPGTRHHGTTTGRRTLREAQRPTCHRPVRDRHGTRILAGNGIRDPAQTRFRCPGQTSLHDTRPQGPAQEAVQHPLPPSSPTPAHRSVPCQLTGQMWRPRNGSYPNAFSRH